MAEENSGFQALIESVNQSNIKLEKVEEHTRNSRRHLLEMKKSVFQMAEITESLASPDTEQRREDVARQERMIDALEAVKGNTKGAGGGAGSQKGGFLGALGGGGLGGFLGGAGLGGGALMAGAGILAGGGALLLKELADFDGAKVKENLNILLSIGDDLVEKEGSILKAFGKTGLLVAMLGGIGVGLAAFGIGAGVNTAVDHFSGDGLFADNIKANIMKLNELTEIPFGDVAKLSLGLGMLGTALIAFGAGKAAATAADGIHASVDKFMGTGDFAQNVVNNVTTLMKIADLKVGDAGETALTLGMLGVGLALFGAGKAVGSVADLAQAGASAAGKSAGVEMFEKGDGFGQRIFTEVSNLLKIPDLKNASLGGVAGFVGTMTGISAGLTVFAYGKALEGGASALSGGVTYFTGKENEGFADRIYREVETLLKIADLNFKDSDGVFGEAGKFAVAMGGISAGLAAFAIGEAGTAVSGFLSKFAGDGEGTGERIAKEVNALLSIGEGQNLDNAAKAGTAMKDLGAGLSDFAKGEFVGSLASVGTAIAGFFSDGPFEKVLELADDADNLSKAANALGLVADNLDKVANIKIGKGTLNFKKFGEDLREGVPSIEKAVLGDEGWFGTKIEGLANNSASYAEAAKNIDTLRNVLGDPNAPAPITYTGPVYQGPVTVNQGGAVAGGGGGGPSVEGTPHSDAKTRRELLDAEAE